MIYHLLQVPTNYELWIRLLFWDATVLIRLVNVVVELPTSHMLIADLVRILKTKTRTVADILGHIMRWLLHWQHRSNWYPSSLHQGHSLDLLRGVRLIEVSDGVRTFQSRLKQGLHGLTNVVFVTLHHLFIIISVIDNIILDRRTDLFDVWRLDQIRWYLVTLVELIGLPICSLSHITILQGRWTWGRARLLAHQSHHRRQWRWRLLLLRDLFVVRSVWELLIRHLMICFFFPDYKFDVFNLLLVHWR